MGLVLLQLAFKAMSLLQLSVVSLLSLVLSVCADRLIAYMVKPNSEECIGRILASLGTGFAGTRLLFLLVIVDLIVLIRPELADDYNVSYVTLAVHVAFWLIFALFAGAVKKTERMTAEMHIRELLGSRLIRTSGHDRSSRLRHPLDSRARLLLDSLCYSFFVISIAYYIFGGLL